MKIIESYNFIKNTSNNFEEPKISNLPMYLAAYIDSTNLLGTNLKDYLESLSIKDFYDKSGISIDFRFIQSQEEFLINNSLEVLTNQPIHTSNLREEIYYALRLSYLAPKTFSIKDKLFTNKTLYEIAKILKETDNPMLILPNLSKSSLSEIGYVEQSHSTEEILSKYFDIQIVFMKNEDEICMVENYIGLYVSELDDIALMPLESYGEVSSILERKVSFVKQNSTVYINMLPIESFLPRGHIRSSFNGIDYR